MILALISNFHRDAKLGVGEESARRCRCIGDQNTKKTKEMEKKDRERKKVKPGTELETAKPDPTMLNQKCKGASRMI